MTLLSSATGTATKAVTSGPVETRTTSALFKRAEQLKRWQESDTYRQPINETSVNLKRKKTRVQFSDGCVFLAACAASDRDEVKRLLDKGADIDTANVDGLTALHQACIDDNLDMVEFLVEHEADINRGDNEGWTPLHATASCGFLSIARYLIEKGAEVHAVNNDRELPIDISESDEMEELLQVEIDAKKIDCDNARNAEERCMLRDIESWSNNRDTYMVDKELNKSGLADSSTKPVFDRPHPKTGAYALHVAASKGYIKVMSLLIEYYKTVEKAANGGKKVSGSNTVKNHNHHLISQKLNVQDFDGWTPLHAAAHWAQKETCEILVSNLASMRIKNCVGQSPFDVADTDVIKWLNELETHQSEKIRRLPLELRNRLTEIENQQTSQEDGMKASNVELESSTDDTSISGDILDEQNNSNPSSSAVAMKQQNNSKTKRRTSITRLSVENKSLISKEAASREQGAFLSPSLNNAKSNKTGSDSVTVGLRKSDPSFTSHKTGSVQGDLSQLLPPPHVIVDKASSADTVGGGMRSTTSSKVNANHFISTSLQRKMQGNNVLSNENSSTAAADEQSYSWRRPASVRANQRLFQNSSENGNTPGDTNTSGDSLMLVGINALRAKRNPSDVPIKSKVGAADQFGGIGGGSENVSESSNSSRNVQNRSKINFESLKSTSPSITANAQNSSSTSNSKSSNPKYATTNAKNGKQAEVIVNSSQSPVSVKINTQNVSPGIQSIRRSFVPPVRDEESETQRKAHAKRVRETRRSTQGVTLEDIKSAEQLVKKKQLEEQHARTSELQSLVQKATNSSPSNSTSGGYEGKYSGGSNSSLVEISSSTAPSEVNFVKPSWRVKPSVNNDLVLAAQQNASSINSSGGNSNNRPSNLRLSAFPTPIQSASSSSSLSEPCRPNVPPDKTILTGLVSPLIRTTRDDETSGGSGRYTQSATISSPIRVTSYVAPIDTPSAPSRLSDNAPKFGSASGASAASSVFSGGGVGGVASSMPRALRMKKKPKRRSTGIVRYDNATNRDLLASVVGDDDDEFSDDELGSGNTATEQESSETPPSDEIDLSVKSAQIPHLHRSLVGGISGIRINTSSANSIASSSHQIVGKNATSVSTFNNRGSSRTGGLSSSSTNLCDDSGVAYTPNDISDMSVNKSVGRVMSNSSDQNIDYKRLWDTLQKDNNKLRDEVIHLKDDLSMSKRKLHSVLKQTEDGDLVNSVTGASSGAGMPSSSSNIMLSESERREKRVLQKKLAEMEEELKYMEDLKRENEQLKAENRALTRVVSKLTQTAVHSPSSTTSRVTITSFNGSSTPSHRLISNGFGDSKIVSKTNGFTSS